MSRAVPSGAETCSRRPDFTAPLRSLSSCAVTPGCANSTAFEWASHNRGGSSRARRAPWPCWGRVRDEGRRHWGRHDALPAAAPGDREGDVFRGDEDGPRFGRPHPRRCGHGRLRDRAGCIRRRRDERRVPARWIWGLSQAVHARLHRRRHRRLQHDRRLVARRVRPRGRRARRERGEDVLVPAASAERLREHLGSDPRPPAEAEPRLDLRDGDEPLHDRVRRQEGGHRPGRGQEQTERRGHPCAQLADPNITVDDVLKSEVMAWPVQRLDISPPSDGASAVILASEDFIRKRRIKDRAWISGVGWCIDSTMWTDRDLVFPEYVARAAKHAYKMAKIDEPRRQIDFAEPYDPFDYKELHHLEGLLLADKGEAPILTREGVTERDGKMPVCPSGGLLGVGNPIAATMGMKIGELFWQLTGQAGKRQIPHEVHTGVSQAWGDLMQYGSVVVMSA